MIGNFKSKDNASVLKLELIQLYAVVHFQRISKLNIPITNLSVEVDERIAFVLVLDVLEQVRGVEGGNTTQLRGNVCRI